MKIACVAALCLLTISPVFAQKLLFERRYTETGPLQSTPNMECRDKTGNFYITGLEESARVVEKVSATGAVLWRYTYSAGDLVESQARGIVVGSDGTVCVAGELDNYFAVPVNLKGTFVFKLNSAGALVWSKSDWTHFGCGGVALDSTNNVIMAEPRQDDQLQTAPENFDLVKYATASGAILWTREQQDASGITAPTDLKSDAAGGFYVLEKLNKGASYQVGHFSTATGLATWTKALTLQAPLVDIQPSALAVMPNNNVIVWGEADYLQSGWRVVTFDCMAESTGAFVWRDLEGDFYSIGSEWLLTNPPKVDSENNIYWAGLSISHGFSSFVGKIDSSGHLLWCYDDGWSSNSLGLAPAPDGGVYNLSFGGFGCYLTRYDPSGQEVWVSQLPLINATDVTLNGSTLAFLDTGHDLFADQSIDVAFYSAVNGSPSGLFQETVNGEVYDSPQTTTKDSFGNTYAASFQANRIAVTKYSGTGALLWNTRINENLPEWNGTPMQLVWAHQGHVSLLIAGKNDFGVARLTDSTGAVQWTTMYSGAHGTLYPESMVEDSAGNLIVGSATNIYSTNPPSYIVLDKFAAATGHVTWEYEESDKYDMLPNLFLDGQNNLCVAGSVLGPSNGGYTLLKLSSAGTVAFDQSANQFPAYGLPNYVVVDSAGNCYLAVLTWGNINLFKYSATGVLGWSKNFSLFGQPTAMTLRLDAANGALVMQAVPGSNYVETIRVSTKDGSQIWAEQYNSPFLHGITSSQLDLDHFGNVVMAVTVPQTGNDPQQIIVRKLAAADSSVRFSKAFAGTLATTADLAAGLTVGTDNTAWVVGSAPSSNTPQRTNTFLAQFADTNPPVSHPDAYTAAENEILTVAAPGVLANDEDAAGATVTVAAKPAHSSSFTLNSDGSFAYKPAANFTGTDSFTYCAKTSYGTGNTATVKITVH